MKDPSHFLLLILPTDDILQEYEPAELILKRIDLSLKDIATFVVKNWIDCEKDWGHPRVWSDISTFELILDYLHSDFLHGYESSRLDRQDRQHVRQILTEFSRGIYRRIIPLIEEMYLSEHQLQHTSIFRWTGDGLILRIPATK